MVNRILRRTDLEQFRNRLRAVTGTMTDMGTVVAQRTFRVETGSAPLILLGASADVPITWSEGAMPSAVYEIRRSGLSGILGRATLTVLSQDAAGCVVRVTADLAVTAGSLFVVVARC